MHQPSVEGSESPDYMHEVAKWLAPQAESALRRANAIVIRRVVAHSSTFLKILYTY